MPSVAYVQNLSDIRTLSGGQGSSGPVQFEPKSWKSTSTSTD